jgi:glycosyltransferase involved in cell wall biosynthesis
MKNSKTEKLVVTVYLACHNYDEYVEQSIESVLAQTYKNFELIIIDDGSTDKSREIISRYVKYPNVRIIFQENKGLIATNNIAIRAANGKYVMRLDADDYLDESALLVLVNAIEKSDDLALVFPDYYYVDKRGNVTGQERRHDFQEEVTLLDQPAHGACTLIRKDYLLEVGGYSGEFDRQDGWDLWLKLTENYSVNNVNLPLFYYRKHGDNLTTNTESLLRTRSEIYNKHAERVGRPRLKVLAILPVRGPIIEKNSQVLERLGKKSLIDWTVDSVLGSKSVTELIVTTPDIEVINYLKASYGGRVTLVERELVDALENTSYKPAVMSIIENKNPLDYDAVLELSADSPFRSTSYIDKAINVMRVHEVDRVLGVIQEDSVFYIHSGSGLELIGNDLESDLLRLERDYLYRQCGGITLTKREYYFRAEGHFNGSKGHIILSKRASTQVKDKFEMKLAELQLKERK